MRTEKFYDLALTGRTFKVRVSRLLGIDPRDSDAFDIDRAAARLLKAREVEDVISILDIILDAIHENTRLTILSQGGDDIGNRPRLRETPIPQPQAWMPRDESGEVIEDGQDVFVNGEYRGRYGASGDMNINEDLPPLDPSGQGGIHMGGKSGSPTWQTTPTPRVIGGSAGQFYSAAQRRNISFDDPNVV